MLKRCLAVVLMTAVLFLNASFARAAERDGIIGTIVEIEGGATVTSSGGSPVTAGEDQPIYLNDVIEVAQGGRALVLLIDNTRWTLSSGAKFTVDEYVFDPADNTDNQARYSVVQGGFQYVSGLVAKKQNPDVFINTPIGSIGIRGTDITASPDETGGYDVYVDEGVINVATEGGTTQLRQGQGSFVKDRKARPGAMRKERLEGMRGMVALKRKEQVMQRIAAMKDRQQALQMKFRDFMQNNPEMKQKLQHRRQMRQQQMQQERKGERQGKMQQLQQQMQESRQEKLEGHREQLRENYQEKIEERREQRQQQWRLRQAN